MKTFLTKTTAILAIIALVVIIVALVIPIKPVSVLSFKTTVDSYKAGDTLTYDIHRCKNVSQEVKGTVVRSLISTNKSLTPIILNLSPTGSSGKGCGKVESSLLLPMNVPTGTYRLNISLSYDVYWPRPEVVQSFTSNNIFYVKGEE